MIKKGDNIIVLTGSDKGKKAKVIKSFPKEGLVIVEGLNMKKRHTKASRATGGKGQIVESARPMKMSNVAVVDPKTGKASRLGKKKIGDKMVRISKKSGSEL